MSDLVKFIVRQVKVSPDLDPSDFYLFSHLKKFLADQQFANDDEIKENVQNLFMSQAAEFYDAGAQNTLKLIEFLKKRLNKINLFVPIPVLPLTQVGRRIFCWTFQGCDRGRFSSNGEEFLLLPYSQNLP
ncbi:hypothetical protein AVEN_37260-1 [Araneus ventricosus]|uniref:Uncharacterized protein n=1 Tax=Araneus ventricosus TaxID=182803 RepID=A0A4Y2KM21_ARAVE|nr:hypothetical protein AVEN_37260-1 [Araneus ventricosus]